MTDSYIAVSSQYAFLDQLDIEFPFESQDVYRITGYGPDIGLPDYRIHCGCSGAEDE